jgi:hypothetical protein
MAQLELAKSDPSQAIRAATAIKALSLAAAGLERLHDLNGLSRMIQRQARA